MMSDLIERQSAISVIDAAFPVNPIQSKYVQGLACGVALAKTYVEQLPSVQLEQRWIPCSERLPDEDGDYLVTVKYNIMHEPICIKSSYSNDLYEIDDFDFEDKKGKIGWYDYSEEYGYVEQTNVIAWMRLPEPYKEELE